MAKEHGLKPMLRSKAGKWGPAKISGEELDDFVEVRVEGERKALLEEGLAVPGDTFRTTKAKEQIKRAVAHRAVEKLVFRAAVKGHYTAKERSELAAEKSGFSMFTKVGLKHGRGSTIGSAKTAANRRGKRAQAKSPGKLAT